MCDAYPVTFFYSLHNSDDDNGIELCTQNRKHQRRRRQKVAPENIILLLKRFQCEVPNDSHVLRRKIEIVLLLVCMGKVC